MTKNATEEIIEKIQLVLREQFKEPKLQIDHTTQANDVVGWDSLRNIEIFINLETAGNKHTLSDSFFL